MATNIDFTRKHKYKRKLTSNINSNSVNLGEILSLCNQIKIGQDELKKDQKRIIKQLNNLEKRSAAEYNKEICLNEFKNTIEQRFEIIEKQLHDKNSEVKNLVADEIKGIANGFDKLEKSITQNQASSHKDIKEKINSYASVVNKNIDKNLKNNDAITYISENLQSMKDNMETKKAEQDEEKAKKHKTNNVILFNMPEANTGNPDLDAQEDVRKLKQIFIEKIHLKKEDFKKIYRRETLNKGTRPRPIIIQFTQSEKKKEILRLRNLMYVDEQNNIHKIYIQPDRTKREQAEHKLLVLQLKESRKEDPNLVIRNGKIMKSMPFRSDPQSIWG